ncbi:hypothetical protein KIN20_012582 [Parelaphostrongylus tenuis]|uniref:Uncharacterized protein n=1 Tax=Parelaphostrongylus tenuis TaxID=148309 RepID=A0AAD5MCD0_PARTN|nr:hypothetical protein KIN20_012582 [Parelaphostrongylus tenuis]
MDEAFKFSKFEIICHLRKLRCTSTTSYRKKHSRALLRKRVFILQPSGLLILVLYTSTNDVPA